MTLLTNIEKKSTLAKLLATENIQVEQNNVQTASFDVENRILTIPIFKHENKMQLRNAGEKYMILGWFCTEKTPEGCPALALIGI